MLVMVAQYSNWVECYALSDQTAERYQSLLGDLDALLSCTVIFESQIFKEVCDLLNIVKTRTTPYRPRANGQVELMNCTILQKENWDNTWLP